MGLDRFAKTSDFNHLSPPRANRQICEHCRRLAKKKQVSRSNKQVEKEKRAFRTDDGRTDGQRERADRQAWHVEAGGKQDDQRSNA